MFIVVLLVYSPNFYLRIIIYLFFKEYCIYIDFGRCILCRNDFHTNVNEESETGNETDEFL